MAMPYHKNTCCRGHEINIFGKPFLGHHYYKLSYSDLWSGAEKKTLKKFINFSLNFPKLCPLKVVGGRWVIKITILYLLPLQVLQLNGQLSKGQWQRLIKPQLKVTWVTQVLSSPPTFIQNKPLGVLVLIAKLIK